VRAIGGGQAAGLARLPLLGRALAAIVAQGRRRPFDLLHAFWADEPGFLAVVAGRLLGAPSVVSLAGGELIALPESGYGGRLSRLNRLLTGLALGGAACVTAGSALLAALARPRASAGRLRIMPLGVDAERFRPGAQAAPRRADDPRRRLLHVGSLTAVKDQATLLRAFALVLWACPHTELHIVGDGPLRAELGRLAMKLGIAGQTHFHGTVPHDQMPMYYQAADLYVHSSSYESQGMALLEAAACGCPLVGTAAGILPELGPAGLNVPVGAHQALATAITALLDDDARRQRMAAAARRLVELRYSLDLTTASLLSLYRELPPAA
jgi:glycosyltransferase involved in cell wall biosynthesis